jgi:hypothetical protein
MKKRYLQTAKITAKKAYNQSNPKSNIDNGLKVRY